MKKLIFLITLTVFISLINYKTVFADSNTPASSAQLNTSLSVKKTDNRVVVLGEFLKRYDSPLADYALAFVENADKYNLDWRLVAAISGPESTFGQNIPSNSFNAWGWGIYGNNVIRFSSWEEGIETVSEGLKTKYIDKWGAKNVFEIGRIYAASPTWAQKVNYFMEKITEFALQNPNSLSISL